MNSSPSEWHIHLILKLSYGQSKKYRTTHNQHLCYPCQDSYTAYRIWFTCTLYVIVLLLPKKNSPSVSNVVEISKEHWSRIALPVSPLPIQGRLSCPVVRWHTCTCACDWDRHLSKSVLEGKRPCIFVLRFFEAYISNNKSYLHEWECKNWTILSLKSDRERAIPDTFQQGIGVTNSL